jgi:hypothetical protein
MNSINDSRRVKRTHNRMRMLISRLTTQPSTTGTTINDDKLIKNTLNLSVNAGESVKLKCSVALEYENNAGVSFVSYSNLCVSTF